MAILHELCVWRGLYGAKKKVKSRMYESVVAATLRYCRTPRVSGVPRPTMVHKSNLLHYLYDLKDPICAERIHAIGVRVFGTRTLEVAPGPWRDFGGRMTSSDYKNVIDSIVHYGTNKHERSLGRGQKRCRIPIICAGSHLRYKQRSLTSDHLKVETCLYCNSR